MEGAAAGTARNRAADMRALGVAITAADGQADFFAAAFFAGAAFFTAGFAAALATAGFAPASFFSACGRALP